MKSTSPRDMLSIIGNMDLLVGVRLHSLIYAAIMGVPLIGISYDPKCTAFLKLRGARQAEHEGELHGGALPARGRACARKRARSRCSASKRIWSSFRASSTRTRKMICAIMEKSRKHTMQDPQNNTEKKDKSGVRTAGAISQFFLLTLSVARRGARNDAGHPAPHDVTLHRVV